MARLPASTTRWRMERELIWYHRFPVVNRAKGPAPDAKWLLGPHSPRRSERRHDASRIFRRGFLASPHGWSVIDRALSADRGVDRGRSAVATKRAGFRGGRTDRYALPGCRSALGGRQVTHDGSVWRIRSGRFLGRRATSRRLGCHRLSWSSRQTGLSVDQRR